MKKQMLSLMLSAVIFTTSPLFAMEQPEDGHLRLNLFKKLPNEKIVDILHKSSIKDISSFSLTSWKMYNLCELNTTWRPFAAKLPISIDESLSIKGQICSHYTLFSKSDQKYSVEMPLLKHILTSIVPNTMARELEFSIGRQDFRLTDKNLFLVNLCSRLGPQRPIEFNESVAMTVQRISEESEKTKLIMTSLDLGVIPDRIKWDILDSKNYVTFYPKPDEECFVGLFGLATHDDSWKIIDLPENSSSLDITAAERHIVGDKFFSQVSRQEFEITKKPAKK